MTNGSDDPTELIEADAKESHGATSAPSDNTTLTSVIEGLTEAGYASQFTARPDAEVHCDACGVVSKAADFDVHSVRRLEGASDPADMVAVVAAACPKCTALGASVLAFGPMGSATDADVMVALDLSSRDDEHHEHHEHHEQDEPT